MSFAAPAFLLAALLVVPAVWLYVRSERRGRRGRAAFAAAPVLPSVAPRRPGWRRHAAIAGYAVAALLLVVALAKPQATVAVPVEQATVVVVTVEVGDPREGALPDAGELVVVDPETDELVEVHSSDPGLRAAFEDAEQTRRADVATALRGARRAAG